MVYYICDRCNKSFMQKIDYTRHILRKKACIPDTSNNRPEVKVNMNNKKKANKKFVCNACNNSFSRKDSLMRHINNNCKHNNVVVADAINQTDPNAIIKELNETIEKLQSIININNNNCNNTVNTTNNITNNTNNITNNTNNITNNTNNITNNTNNIINILPYGKENTSYISDKDYKQYIKSGYGAFRELISNMHFNKNHPENHNICIANKKFPHVSAFDGTDWKDHDKTEFIDKIIDDKFILLEKKVHELNNKNQIEQKLVDKFEEISANIDEPKERKYVTNNVYFVLYNGRNTIKETKKLTDKSQRKIDEIK